MLAADITVTEGSRGTGAFIIIKSSWCTDGHHSTWVGVARIWLFNTFVLLANVSVLTVGVDFALGSATSDGIGLGDESGETVTNGLSV